MTAITVSSDTNIRLPGGEVVKLVAGYRAVGGADEETVRFVAHNPLYTGAMKIISVSHLSLF